MVHGVLCAESFTWGSLQGYEAEFGLIAEPTGSTKAMATSKSAREKQQVNQIVFAESPGQQGALKLTEVLSRQRWVIMGMMSLGLALSSLYWTRARVWYESRAKVLVSQRDPGLTSTTTSAASAEAVINEDVLANHMEVFRSRRIVEEALKAYNLETLPSILDQIEGEDIDAADYVIDHLKLTRGGEGTAKDARSLTIAFEHTSADDTRLILEAILVKYQQFLGEQLSKAMSEANTIVKDARNSLEEELENIQRDYIEVRQSAPVIFQGEGSSNVYLEQFKRLHEESLTLDIQESSAKARLEKARAVVAAKGDESKITIDDLGVIDSDSLTRLGVFAGLQANAAKTAEFQATQPERLEEARTNYTLMLKLLADKRRLEADFGPGHPEVRKLDEEIALVKSFVEERSELLNPGWQDEQMTPGGLLKAYLAYLESDISAISERRRELGILIADAESQSRTLVEYELREGVLRSRLERTQSMFDGLVEQLRDLDLVSGMQGYIHELLEAPRIGEVVWPSLPICGIGGLMLGTIAGLFFALVNDQLDNRFRSSSEIDTAIGLSVMTRIGRLRLEGNHPIVRDNTPEGESFRLVRTLLLNDIRSGKLRVLSATSPLPGDGKTTIMANVAVAFAKLDMSVVLVEADIRRPTFHKRFQIPEETGLSEHLRGLASLDDVLVKSDVPNLTLLPAGGGTLKPSELLQNESFDVLMTTLRERFELVIVDVGPVLAVSDAVIVGQKADGMLLIVRSSNDTRQQVVDAVDTLRSAGVKMIGCILNTFGSGNEFERAGYYGYYYADRTPRSPSASEKLMSVAAGGNGTELK